ncbi:MAG: DUF1573 domain-containing protein [Planctomycetota bacterium]
MRLLPLRLPSQRFGSSAPRRLCGVLAVGILLPLLALTAAAQQVPDASQPPAALATTGTARLEVLEPTIDLGDLLWGTFRIVEFSLTNRGDAPLKIEKVIPGCGCMTVVDFDAEIAPQARGSVRVRLETRRLQVTRDPRTGEPAATTKGCIIKSNHAEPAPAKITTRFTIQPLFTLPPLPLEVKVLPDKPGTMSFDITPVTTPPADLLRVETVHNIGKASLAKLAGGGYRLTLDVPPTSKVGVSPENIRMFVQHPDIQDGAEVACEIALGIVFVDRIQQSAPSLSFRRKETTAHLAAPETPLRKTVTLWTEQPDYEFKLVSAALERAPAGAFSVEVEEVEPGRRYSVHVTVLEVQKGAPVSRGVLVLTTDDKYRAVRKVTVIAQFPK